MRRGVAASMLASLTACGVVGLDAARLDGGRSSADAAIVDGRGGDAGPGAADARVGAFAAPVPALVQTTGTDDDATVSADGLELYFDGSPDDLYRATRTSS